MFWSRKHIITYLLFPLSILYRLIISLRKKIYRSGLIKIYRSPLPMIVVGNINLGGTGKTPLIIALSLLLKKHGFKPGIISRGYKGKSLRYPILLNNLSDPLAVGDEPALLVRKLSCRVVVDPDRCRAAEYLVKKTDCNIILSDDGLQHYRLDRDIEIAVVAADLGFSNGHCLPTGLLREPISRLNETDFILINQADKTDDLDAVLKSQLNQLQPPKFIVKPIVAQPQLINGQFKSFKPKRLHALAGIGVPERFFNSLKNLGLDFVPHAFPDHYAFTSEDFNFMTEQDEVIMTEKDAIKCQAFADDRFWCLPITIDLPVDFETQLLKKLSRISFGSV